MKTDLILTADWHLREDTPVCRTDDFWKAQWDKIDEIIAMGKPILHAGDLFNNWKGTPNLISEFIVRFAKYHEFKNKFYTIYGNHDLPQHNLDLAYKTAMHTLECAEAVQILKEAHWEQEPEGNSIEINKRAILLYHVMTWKGEKPWPGCTDLSAKQILKKYPQYDLIVTGHNHKTFTEEYKGRILVNPGSLTRQSADQHKNTPCVFLYHAKNHKIQRQILTHNKQAVSRAHLQQVANKKQRYAAFLQHAKTNNQKLLKFEENLEQFFQQNKTPKKIRKHIYDNMEGV
jgi:putative phosphoesterase